MAPIIKTHDLKYGYIQMEILDETTGLRFYWHNNKLADKPILLFPSGMVALVKALRRAYEIYDDQVLRLAELALCQEQIAYSSAANGELAEGEEMAPPAPPQYPRRSHLQCRHCHLEGGAN